MNILRLVALGAALSACSGSSDPDGGARDGATDARTGVDACPGQIEICGDRIDQNCDGRDQSCGDNDGDRFAACRAGDDLTACDCDDSRADSFPGRPEECDGRDNDCNGRVDEIASCCPGCAGAPPNAADSCTADGRCDCAGEPGIGACAAGETCCGNGCTDVQTDLANCGFCARACGDAADSCAAGSCRCGAGPVCQFTNQCRGGTCN